MTEKWSYQIQRLLNKWYHLRLSEDKIIFFLNSTKKSQKYHNNDPQRKNSVVVVLLFVRSSFFTFIFTILLFNYVFRFFLLLFTFD